MKQFTLICKIQFRLFLREFFGFFFTLVFPVLMLILFGSIFGNNPIYPESEIRMIDITIPAYSVMVIGVTGLMSFPLTLSEYKEKKIYKRFDATPVGKKNIILAQITVNITMTLIGILILLIAGKFLYRIKIQGSAISVCFAVLFSIAAMFSMGFLFTAIGKDAKMTNLLCYLFYFIMLFLSGATMPASLFPESIKTFSGLLPMTYAVNLMQGIFAGNSLGVHWKEILILGVLTVIFTGTGAFLYRKKDWT